MTPNTFHLNQKKLFGWVQDQLVDIHLELAQYLESEGKYCVLNTLISKCDTCVLIVLEFGLEFI